MFFLISKHVGIFYVRVIHVRVIHLRVIHVRVIHLRVIHVRVIHELALPYYNHYAPYYASKCVLISITINHIYIIFYSKNIFKICIQI